MRGGRRAVERLAAAALLVGAASCAARPPTPVPNAVAPPVAAPIVPPTVPPTADPYRWTAFEGEDGAHLAHGAAATDDVTVSFVCARGRVQVYWLTGRARVRTRAVRLDAGGRTLTAAARSGADGALVAQAALDALAPVLLAAGPLRLAAGDAVETMAATGRVAAARRFVAACARR